MFLTQPCAVNFLRSFILPLNQLIEFFHSSGGEVSPLSDVRFSFSFYSFWIETFLGCFPFFLGRLTVFCLPG